MKKMTRRGLWILASLIVLAAVGVGVTLGIQWIADPFGSEYSVETSEPLTLSEARQQGCPIDLPEGASNVSFSFYSYWVAYEVYVKFEAPLDVCKAHALRIVKKHNSKWPDSAVPDELQPLQGPFEPIITSDPGWFDLDRINSALVIWPDGRRGGSHQPAIWIDTDRNVFYYMYTD